MIRSPRPLLLSVLLLLTAVSKIPAQSVPIGSLQEELLLLEGLLTDSLTTISLTSVNRPFTRIFSNEVSNTSTKTNKLGRLTRGKIYSIPGGFESGLHPFQLQGTYNSILPHGENNQAAWYGTGMNPELMGGLWLASNYLTISIHPHIVWQQNKEFLRPRYAPTNRYEAEAIGVRIDSPYRFGNESYWTFDWGYSSIRLHYESIEAGISSEPLWWGPAVRYPLLMSNNAPGVHHAFVGTREALHLPYLGSFQFRWIIGYPQESKYVQRAIAGEKRFLNALNAAWSPAFLPQLTTGIIRLYHIYENRGFDWDNVTVMFNPFQKLSLPEDARENWQRTARNQAASFYAIFRIPEANAELYGEFFREDHSYDWRDFFQQPHQNSGWAVGIQKVFYAPLANIYKFNLEVTNLTISQIYQTRHQTYYYTHNTIRHGHTNRGHVLGAAIGPGSGSQFASLDAYRDDVKIGLMVQRVVENDTFHLRTNSITDTNREFGDYYRHRVNLNLGVNFLYGPGPFYLTGSFIWTKAYNYGRFDYGRGQNLTNYDRKDLYNSQLQMGITYVF